MTLSLSSPVDVVRRFMRLMESLDYDAALKLVSATCEYANPPPSERSTARPASEPFWSPSSLRRGRMRSRSCARRRPARW